MLQSRIHHICASSLCVSFCVLLDLKIHSNLKIQNYIHCISLWCALSCVSFWGQHWKMHTHRNCICLSLWSCECFRVSWYTTMYNCTGNIFFFFMCLLKKPALEDAYSHKLHLFVSLILFSCFLMSLTRARKPSWKGNKTLHLCPPKWMLRNCHSRVMCWKLLKRSFHHLKFLISAWYQFLGREGRNHPHLLQRLWQLRRPWLPCPSATCLWSVEEAPEVLWDLEQRTWIIQV